MFIKHKISVEYNDESRTLQRCPVCNGNARYMRFDSSFLFSTKHYYYVECGECGLNTKVQNTVEDARRKWNGV